MMARKTAALAIQFLNAMTTSELRNSRFK
jgi:hypothetical protein